MQRHKIETLTKFFEIEVAISFSQHNTFQTSSIFLQVINNEAAIQTKRNVAKLRKAMLQKHRKIFSHKKSRILFRKGGEFKGPRVVENL